MKAAALLSTPRLSIQLLYGVIYSGASSSPCARPSPTIRKTDGLGTKLPKTQRHTEYATAHTRNSFQAANIAAKSTLFMQQTRAPLCLYNMADVASNLHENTLLEARIPALSYSVVVCSITSPFSPDGVMHVVDMWSTCGQHVCRRYVHTITPPVTFSSLI